MPNQDGTGPYGKGPIGGGYRRQEELQKDIPEGDLEKIARKGQGPCGNGQPRNGGRGLGRGGQGRCYRKQPDYDPKPYDKGDVGGS